MGRRKNTGSLQRPELRAPTPYGYRLAYYTLRYTGMYVLVASGNTEYGVQRAVLECVRTEFSRRNRVSRFCLLKSDLTQHCS